MAIRDLEDALHEIKVNLDVGCTCHLYHGALCPKRIAEVALARHAIKPEAVVPDGIEIGTLARNNHVVDLAARRIFQGLIANGMITDLPPDKANDFYDDRAENIWWQNCIADARAALEAVDELRVYPKEAPQ